MADPFWPKQRAAVEALAVAMQEHASVVNELYEEREHQLEIQKLGMAHAKFDELWRRTLKELRKPSTSAAHAAQQQGLFDRAAQQYIASVATWTRVGATKPAPYPARPKPPPGRQAI